MSLHRIAFVGAVGLLTATAAQAAPAELQHFDTRQHVYEGSPTAPVKVVVFEDFKCPVCREFELRYLPQLRTKYIETGKVQLFRFSYPFLADRLPVNDSMLAAEAVRCIYGQKGNAAALKMSGLLFSNQGDERLVWATPEKLRQLAAQVQGVQLKPFQGCMAQHDTRAFIKADMAQGDRAELAGTPSVYVNGRFVEEFDTQGVSETVDAALKK